MPSREDFGAVPITREDFGAEPIAPLPEPTWGSRVNEFTSGINSGLANIAGLPVDVIASGLRALMRRRAGGISDQMEMPNPAVGGANVRVPLDPLGGSESIKRGLEAVGIEDHQPTDRPGRIIRRTGEEIGAAAVPMAGAMGKAAQVSRTGEELSGLARFFVEPFVKQPIKAAATETALAAGAGAGAGYSRELFGPTPGADITGAVGGSLATGGLLGISKMITDAVRAAFTPEQTASRVIRETVGGRLKESTLDEGTAFGPNLTESKRLESAVPGMKMTTGEATRDPGLQALEYSRRSAGPNVGAFQQRRTDNNQAINQALEAEAPAAKTDEATRAELERRRERAVGAAQNIEGAKGRQAERTVEAVQPGMSSQEAGREIRGTLARGKDAMESVRDAEALPLLKQAEDSGQSVYVQPVLDLIDGKLAKDKRESVRSALTRAREKMFVPESPDGGPAKPVKPAQSKSLLAAISELGGIDVGSRLDIMGGNERVRAGVGNVFRKGGRGLDAMVEVLNERGYIPSDALEDVDGGVQWLRDAIRDEADGRTKYYSAFDEENVFERYARARDEAMGAPDEADRALDETVSGLYEARKAINDMIAGRGETATDRFAKKELIEVRDALDAQINEAAPEFGDYLKRYSEGSKLVDPYRAGASKDVLDADVTGRPDVPDSEVAGRFFRSGKGAKEAIQEFEINVGGNKQAVRALRDYAIGDAMKAAATPDGVISTKALDNWIKRHQEALDAYPEIRSELGSVAAAQKSLERAAKRTKALESGLDDPKQSTIAKYLDREEARDSMQAILSSTNPRREMTNLVRTVRRDPDAREGAKRALWDLMMEGSTKSPRAGIKAMTDDTAGTPLLKPAVFKAFMKKHGDAMKILYEDNPGHLERLEKIVDAVAAGQRTTGIKPPGSSGTALGGRDVSVPGLTVAGLVSRSYAYARGVVSLPYLVMETGGRVARRGYLNMKSARVEELLDRALLEPDLAKTLVMEYNDNVQNVVARRLRLHLGNEASVWVSDKPGEEPKQEDKKKPLGKIDGSMSKSDTPKRRATDAEMTGVRG